MQTAVAGTLHFEAYFVTLALLGTQWCSLANHHDGLYVSLPDIAIFDNLFSFVIAYILLYNVIVIVIVIVVHIGSLAVLVSRLLIFPTPPPAFLRHFRYHIRCFRFIFRQIIVIRSNRFNTGTVRV